MAELGAEAEALIRAGRGALRPTSVDRERNALALRARIEGGATSTLPKAAATAKPGLGWPTLSAVVVGLGVGGLFVAGTFQSKPSPASAHPPAASVAAPSALVQVQAAPAPEALPVVERQPSVQDAPPQTQKRPSDRLAEEVEILSRAQKELHASRFAGALRMLEEHARTFPRGTLAPERRAARIQALCGLGRKAEADAELARLSPGSLHEGRAREACAARPKSAAD